MSIGKQSGKGKQRAMSYGYRNVMPSVEV
jgi:hypothetical protein